MTFSRTGQALAGRLQTKSKILCPVSELSCVPLITADNSHLLVNAAHGIASPNQILIQVSRRPHFTFSGRFSQMTKANYLHCRSCVKRFESIQEMPPCLKAFTRMKQSGQHTLEVEYSHRVGEGSTCPNICTWEELVRFYKMAKQGMAFNCNEFGQPHFRKIRETLDAYENLNHPENDSYRLKCNYVLENDRYVYKRPNSTGGDAVFIRAFNDHPGWWQSFLEYYAEHVAVDLATTWVGVGIKGGVNVIAPEANAEGIVGYVWNMSHYERQGIQLSTSKMQSGVTVNAGTPCIIIVVGTPNCNDLLNKSFEGGFDFGFSVGLKAKELFQAIFSRTSYNALASFAKAAKQAGGAIKPSAVDNVQSAVKALVASRGLSSTEPGVIVMDAPVGLTFDISLTFRSTTTVKAIGKTVNNPFE